MSKITTVTISPVRMAIARLYSGFQHVPAGMGSDVLPDGRGAVNLVHARRPDMRLLARLDAMLARAE